LLKLINPNNIKFFILFTSFAVLACSSAPPADEYTYLEKGNEYLGFQGQTRVYIAPNYLAAIKEYTKALEINPEFKDAYYYRGKSYHGLGKYEKAIKDFTTLINKNPGNDDYYLQRSSSYVEMAIDISANYGYQLITNDPDENYYQVAITDATKALELNPNSELAYYNRGKSYYGLKNYQQAITEYDKCIAINPQNGDAILDQETATRMLTLQPKVQDGYTNIITSDEPDRAVDEGLDFAQKEISAK